MNRLLTLPLVWISTAFIPATAGDGLYIDTDYRDCIARIEASAEDGRRAALRWITDGGGKPARHCAAIADLAADLPRLAGSRLYRLAEEETPTDPLLAARLFAQAADAFLAAGEDKTALGMIDEAYALAPNALELHIIAARIYAGTGRWGLSKRALDNAEALAPLDAPSYVLRGRANQTLADYDAAAEDVRNALNLNPDNIDALLLRGELVQIGYVIDPYLAGPDSFSD